MAKTDTEATAFVTGATGLLGYAIAEVLRQDGIGVSALTRSGELPGDLVSLGVEPVRGDLDSRERLAAAMRGTRLVFHAAADVNMWRNRWADSLRTNVTGTRNLLAAAQRAGVEKVVYTSSASTIGKPPPGGAVVTLDERDEYNLGDLQMVYPHTKWLGELAVAEAVDSGLDAVITHPTMILGPGDWKGNLLPLFRGTSKGTLLVAPRGYRSTCDVRDVARGHLLAAERGVAGERYILSGESMPSRELFQRIARAVGGRGPLFTLPDKVLLGVGKVSESLADLTGRAPAVSWEMAYQATLRVRITSAKAERELGYRSRPLEESLQDSVAWYRARGML